MLNCSTYFNPSPHPLPPHSSSIPSSFATLLSISRPEILKQEIKVFFVKYNDPIYVKLEKLDIMIRLASQANIAQVPTAPKLPKNDNLSFAISYNHRCYAFCAFKRL